MKPLLVATTNAGKVAELIPMLAGLGREVIGLGALDPVPPAPEDESDFAGNARSKAQYYERHSGLPTLADDSGLEVAALGGEPGVRSARFAGPEADDRANNALLLRRMQGRSDRRARFVCALCLIEDGRPSCEVEGTVEGQLQEAPRGDGGFGYDPLFVADDEPSGRTFAELSRDAKRRLSHRGRALAALLEALATREGGPA